MMKEIFIIGSKGIPAQYGGFETFVEKLTQYQESSDIKYHVSCMGTDEREFEYNGARCFNIKVPNIGASKAIYYDLMAIKKTIKYIRKHKIRQPVIYILACRIGPFISHYKKELEESEAMLFVNPDGHEWKRAKWNWLIRKYWKTSEKQMVKNADLLICDSKNIEKYIQDDFQYYKPNTKFIAYGAEMHLSEYKDIDENVTNWYQEKKVTVKEYYLVVGRFVPENNYETMIKEFMKSNTSKDFVIVTNIEQNVFFEKLKKITNFNKDKRIKFVGTIYDQNLLKKVRENAYGYLHGHEVGGTNPSLLESLAITNLNLLLDIGFNQEVAEESALYWTKKPNELANKINEADKMDEQSIVELGENAKKRIEELYNWNLIVNKYESLFLLDVQIK